MKKHWLFTTLLAIALCVICFTLFPTEANAASVDDLTFTLNSDGQSYAVTECSSTASGSLTIPSTYNGKPVTSIGKYAFYSCDSLTSVTIPDSVTSIGSLAFYYCDSLTSVTIPGSVTSIGDDAFSNCSSLTSVTIPDSVTSISSGAFYNCDSLTSVTIPNGVTSIGDNAFYYCDSLTSVTISGSVTSIGDNAFSNCSSLTSVTIPGSVTSIGESAFSDCSSLTSVTIPDSVTSISSGAFYYCSSLTSVTIGNGVTNIGDSAFYSCDSLTDVYYTGTESQWAQITIDDSNEDLTDATIHYEYGSMKIVTQPKTAKVKSGATAKYTVAATGNGLTYQWQSSVDGKSWKNCSSSSAKKAAFTFTAKTSHSSNYYRCKVTNSAGKTVYTDAVRLYVLGVTTQPKTQKVEAGEKVKFTVTATGASKTYQWQSSADGKTWKNCSSSSATSATFTFTGKTSHSSNYYRCRIKDSGGNTVYTDAVRLYVLGITEQPVSKTVTKGKTAKFTVEATGASKVYQWQVSTDGGKTWKNCVSSSATKATFTFTSKTTHNGNYYRCRIKDSGGNTVYSSKVKLTVK